MSRQEILIKKNRQILIPTHSGIGSKWSEGQATDTRVLAFQAEIMRLGFIMDQKLLERISQLDNFQLTSLYDEVLSILSKLVGNDVDYTPFYPNFPSQVLEASDVELFFNALLHYWTFGQWRPSYTKNARLPAFENINFKILTLGTEEDISDTFRFGLTRRFTRQYLQLNTNRQNVERRSTDESLEQNSTVLRHRYQSDSSFTLESIASVIDSDDDTLSTNRDTRYLQWSTYGLWRPKKSAVTVTGGVRYNAVLNENAVGETDAETIFAHTGMNYDFSRHLRMTANVTYSQRNTETNNVEERRWASVQTLGASYHPDYLDIGKYQYNWNTSATVRNRSGSDEPGQQFIGQLGHTLQRSFQTSGYSNVSTSVSQMLAEEMDTETESKTRATHIAALTWNRAQSRRSMFLRLMASDSRTFGAAKEELYQFINLQFSSNQANGSYSLWNGSLSIQSVRRDYGDSDDTDFHTSSSGNLIYQRRKLFGVQRLRFTSDLKLNAEEVLPVSLGDEDSRRNVWTNRLDYSIGRLDMQLSYRLSRTYGNNHELLMFRLKRRFGR